MKTIQIRVKRASISYSWYNDHVGEVFTVNAIPENHRDCELWRITSGRHEHGGIWASDAEVVPAEPRLYLHNGKEYAVPEWAKHVTCDGEGKPLFGWEEKPTWHGGSLGYYISDDSRREKLVEYVEPMPVGSFIEAV